MLHKTGVPTVEQVSSRFPKHTLLLKPKAIIECYEEIPCNPCSTSCPFDAITIGNDINKQPIVNFNKCTGCGVCVYNCPGLAIFTVQEQVDHFLFKIPYEFVPYPNEHEVVHGINREGKIIGDVIINKIRLSKKQDKTALLEVRVPKQYLYDFITIRRKV